MERPTESRVTKPSHRTLTVRKRFSYDCRAEVVRLGPFSPVKLIVAYEGGAEVATNRSLDAIIAALGEILMSAPARERQRLAQAIEQYAIRFPTAFRDLRNGHPAPSMREIFQELMDSVDAHPE